MVHPLVGRFHPKPRRQIREIFCALPNDSVDLLDSLLRLNPSKRLSSNNAVQGKYPFKGEFTEIIIFYQQNGSMI